MEELEGNLTTILTTSDEDLRPSDESPAPKWELNNTSEVWPAQFRNDPWIIPLVVLSTLNITVIVFFEVYVLYKSCGNRRHLFLGQILLFGLFLCSVLGYAFVPIPHWASCSVIRAGVGIAYAIVFSTLLVKCVFLLNLHVGLYLNSCYQGLLLFFAVSVQVVIAVQWLVYYPPDIIPISTDTTRNRTSVACRTSPADTIKYLSYVMFLMLLVVIACIRARGLRENNKEALYIGLAMVLVVPMWVSWLSVSLIFDRMYSDPAEGFGLVLIATVVFCLVFVPKAVQLGSAHRSSADRISSGSHSVYTPSFFHMQPHAVLPSSNQGTLVKQTSGTDYYRAQQLKFLRYDYTSPYQMAPHSNGFSVSNLSSTRKPNVTFAHAHLY